MEANANTTFTIDGSKSFFALIRIGGGAGGSGTLSDSTPDSLTADQSGAAGTSTEASRGDHAHAINAGEPVAVSTANAEGSSATFARANHRHIGVESIAVAGTGIAIDQASGAVTITGEAVAVVLRCRMPIRTSYR